MRWLIALIAAIAGYWTLTTLQMDHFADDPGVGWHLRSGEYVLREGAAPRLDPFLGGPPPREWISDQWLSDAVLAWLYHHGGWPVTYGVLTSIFFLTFMLIGASTSFSRSGSTVASAAAGFIGLKLSSVHFILRPVIFAFLLFALLMHGVWRIGAKIRSGEPLLIRDGILFIPLFAVWANIHPSFTLGLLILGLAIIGLLYDAVLIDRRGLPRRDFAILVGVFLGSAAASLCNPYGLALLAQAYRLIGSEFFMHLNTEWRPMNPASGEGQLFFAAAGIIVLGAFLSSDRVKTIRFTELFILGFLSCAALKSVRFLPFFAAAAGPFIAASLKTIASFEPLGRLPIIGALRNRGTPPSPESGAAMRIFRVGVLALGAAPILSAVTIGDVLPFRGPFGPTRERFPYDAVQHLRAAADRAGARGPINVAATPDWGGFIAWAGGGTVRPIIDDRNSLLGEAPYRDYLASTAIGGDIRGYLERVNAAHLLLKHGEPLAVYLRDTHTLAEIWRDERFSIFKMEVGSERRVPYN